jgi:hypothetical protein
MKVNRDSEQNLNMKEASKTFKTRKNISIWKRHWQTKITFMKELGAA